MSRPTASAENKFTLWPCLVCGRLGLTDYCSPGCSFADLTQKALQRGVFPDHEKDHVIETAASLLGTWPEEYPF
jgi:hypothetical protein